VATLEDRQLRATQQHSQRGTLEDRQVKATLQDSQRGTLEGSHVRATLQDNQKRGTLEGSQEQASLGAGRGAVLLLDLMAPIQVNRQSSSDIMRTTAASPRPLLPAPTY
jgi:hypothetical protein